MSLDLHAECRKRLVEKLAAALPTFTVHNGKFLDYASTQSLAQIDSTLPKGQLRQTLSRYVSDLPFSDFVRGALQIRIWNSQAYDAERNPVALTTIDNYSDPLAVAAHLVEAFISLPWQYALTVALPTNIGDFLHAMFHQFSFSTEIRVVTPDEQFTIDYPPPPQRLGPFQSYNSLSTSLLGSQQTAWDGKTMYLQVRVPGFIPMFGNTTPLDDGIDYLKSFFGLGIALYLFEVEKKLGDVPNENFALHRMEGDKWKYERSVDLNRSVSGLLSNLKMHEVYQDPESANGLLNVAKKKVELISAVLAAEPLSSRRLLLAAQWLFDSYAGSDEMLSFVQAAVVLEILLGDKAASDVVGLGELLRNRCAYLISRNPVEREEILKDFPIIYNVRSKIVHEGKKRLNMAEWKLLSRLFQICQRTIRTEARLLARMPR